jgi:hypothetical protein
MAEDTFVDDTLAMVCRDPAARRELLWLRARQASDEWALALLERADATLGARMAALLAEHAMSDQALAAVWAERFAVLAARLPPRRSEDREEGELPVVECR